MGRVDFGAVNSILDPETLVPQWLPDGKRVGREWVARNPTRGDSNPGSFLVNIVSGKWSDFAESGARTQGGDLVSLWAYLHHNGNQIEAAADLLARYGDVPAAPRKPKPPEKRAIIPAPDDAPPCRIWHPKWGAPANTHTYRDEDERIILHVGRFDTEGGKQVLPYTFCDFGDGTRKWANHGVDDRKRPLYGLNRIASRPAARIVIVEGELKADLLNGIADKSTLFVGWLGGANAAAKVDVAPLTGRDVVLWPDADAQRYGANHAQAGQLRPMHEQPGWAAVTTLARLLAPIAASVRVMRYTIGERADGWDGGDAVKEGWSFAKIAAFIETCAESTQEAAKVVVTPRNDGRTPLSEALNRGQFPELGPKLAPLGTIENFEHMLAGYGITVRYDEISKTERVSIPGRDYTVDNAANCALIEVESLCVRNGLTKSVAKPYLHLLADKHAYSPVRDWIDSKPWDGVNRWADFMRTIRVRPDKESLRDLLMGRWMLSAIALAYGSNNVAHGCLVLQGLQSQGKTSWARKLVPQGSDLVATGRSLDPANKDSVKGAISRWINELGELDSTFKKSEMSRLKAFITEDRDSLRLPYAAVESTYPRRTVFMASVNDEMFLSDDTGNRRWWTIACIGVDYQHTFDMQQVWAEVLAAYRAGAQWYLSREEEALLEVSNAEHARIDPLDELIRRKWAWPEPGVTEPYHVAQRMTATEVLVRVGYERPDSSMPTKVAKILRRLAGPSKRSTGGARLYDMPYLRNDDLPSSGGDHR